MEKRVARAVGLVVSIFIVLLLVFLGPAGAVLVSLSIADSNINQGEPIDFEYTFTVEDEETINIHNFTLILTGPENITCSFYPNGTKIDYCPGITIIQTDPGNETFGYGYGYNYLPGTLKFKILINSSLLDPGHYFAEILALYDSSSKTTEIKNFTIGIPFEPVSICSFRSKLGSAMFNNSEFGDENRLSLNLPISKNNKKGQGIFTSQFNKHRLSYKFEVSKATRISQNTVEFDISGSFRDDLKERETKSGKIVLDKANNKASLTIIGLTVSEMDVTFIRGC